MYLKSRLLKLEKSLKRGASILVMFQSTDGWTPEEAHQIADAEAQNITVLIVKFV